jgi:aminoglycoside phosphotransferase (APT) family kinase protein
MCETVGRLLAAGNVAEVFEWGSRALKLYRSPAAKRVIFGEAASHAAVEALGLPVPAVWSVERIGDRWGIVLDRVSQGSFAQRMRDDPTLVPRYLDILARLQARVHAHPALEFGSLKLRLATNIAGTRLLAEPQRRSLLRSLANMPDGDRLCHGDFHPMNVLGDAAQPMVIDWPDASRGDPAADVCRSYLLMKLHPEDLAEPYLEAYCRFSGVPRQTVFGWLSYLAAARLAEDVAGEVDELLTIVRGS